MAFGLVIIGTAWAVACWLVHRRYRSAMRRNEAVSEYRSNLIDQIQGAALSDIEAGLDWHWRWEAYEAVTYEAMCKNRKRPVESFYEDMSFTRPTRRTLAQKLELLINTEPHTSSGGDLQ